MLILFETTIFVFEHFSMYVNVYLTKCISNIIMASCGI